MNKESLIDLLAEISGSNEVRTNPQVEMFETQVLDSMRAVELIVELDERFGIIVSPAELDRANWATPEKFVADVLARSTVSA